MEKTDLSKLDKRYYSAGKLPEIVEIGHARYASITGMGDPSGPLFASNIQQLYSTVYTLKFQSKANGQDFVVPKLEGLWWFDEIRFGSVPMTEAPKQIPRSEWHYRLLLRLPDFITPLQLEQAIESAEKKGKISSPFAVEWFEMTEGKCIQILHTGPFNTEVESLLKLQDFSNHHQFSQNGLHHEIYLSDFRKTAPEKLRTILREPVC